MNKKEKYEELAQKTLRECMNVGENSQQKSITKQLLELHIKWEEWLKTEEKTDFKILCPFFKEIDKEEDIGRFFSLLSVIYEEEYKKFETENFKPTQVFVILLFLEYLWGYQKLHMDILSKLKRFSLTASIVVKWYLTIYNLDEEKMWDICSSLNELF